MQLQWRLLRSYLNQPKTSLSAQRWISSSTSASVSTGAVENEVDDKKGHMEWMKKKESIGQDMFFVSAPGPEARRLIRNYAKMMNRQIEFITITRDTTESDLKQRRELINSGKSIAFTNQAPVRAAIDGKLLVLDGIHRAERNVLPTLNNLLENRELQLEDGSFIVSHKRYQEIFGGSLSSPASSSTSMPSSSTLQNGKENKEKKNKLISAHQDFRVVAIGSPCPPFHGKPLDPPLRSRFQSRLLLPSSAGELFGRLLLECPQVNKTKLKEMVTIASAIHSLGAFGYSTLNLQHGGSNIRKRVAQFPESSLVSLSKILEIFPAEDPVLLLSRNFPLFPDKQSLPLPREWDYSKKFVKNLVDETKTKLEKTNYAFKGINNNTFVFAERNNNSTDTEIKIQSQTKANDLDATSLPLYKNAKSFTILSAMLQDHLLNRDILLLGESGSGKSHLVKEFAKITGMNIRLFSLNRDMAARDLLQQRITNESGDTIYVDSPVIEAATHGDLLVLDGIDRLDRDTFAAIHPLLDAQFREIDLPDGRRLTLENKQIHSNFRVIGLASPPGSRKRPGSSTSSPKENLWFNEELFPLFSLFYLPPLDATSQQQLIQHRFPNAPKDAVEKMLAFSEKFSSMEVGGLREITGLKSLSTRQIIRMAKRMSDYPQFALKDLRRHLKNLLMVQFFPLTQRSMIEKAMDDVQIPKDEFDQTVLNQPLKITTENNILSIGDVSQPIYDPIHPELVPSPYPFFDIPSHTYFLRDLLCDVTSQHLLLIGGQGVGKNKLVDRLLQLLNREREYIQLHRDSTVGSITLTPTVVDGKLVFDESPLTRAALYGRVLVVDEADKAPLEVIAVLKSLVEDGEMLLSDGRRLLSPERYDKLKVNGHLRAKDVRIHEQFRCIVLANRPGWPFLGNSLFQEIGDVFAVHVIPNPDSHSEKILLKSYGPNVPDQVLDCLVGAFRELRKLTENQELSYPFSTREVVAVVKHLEKYPEDGVIEALMNVMSFEVDPRTWKIIAKVLQAHDIPIPDTITDEISMDISIKLSKEESLPPPVRTETWKPRQ